MFKKKNMLAVWCTIKHMMIIDSNYASNKKLKTNPISKKIVKNKIWEMKIELQFQNINHTTIR